VVTLLLPSTAPDDVPFNAAQDRFAFVPGQLRVAVSRHRNVFERAGVACRAVDSGALRAGWSQALARICVATAANRNKKACLHGDCRTPRRPD